MPWYINTTVYELKGSLSRFIRALSRGDADFIVVKRYGRPVTFMFSVVNLDQPALPPESEADKAMRARSYWRKRGEVRPSRRPPPAPDLF